MIKWIMVEAVLHLTSFKKETPYICNSTKLVNEKTAYIYAQVLPGTICFYILYFPVHIVIAVFMVIHRRPCW